MDDVAKYSYPTGYVFSPCERVALGSSMPLLAATVKRQNLILWGKVFGYRRDYLVLKAFDDDAAAEAPELFYSVDGGLTFALLGTTASLLAAILSPESAGPTAGSRAPAAPLADVHNPLELQELKITMLMQMRGGFMGDPAYEYRVRADVRRGSPSTGAADAAKDSDGMCSLKESVRLALFVEEHDYHCRVAPRGAYYHAESSVDGSGVVVRRHPTFRGLRKAGGEAVSLKNYYHLRQANAYRIFLSADDTSSGAMYYLPGNRAKNGFQKLYEDQKVDARFECLSDDVPTGVWTLAFDPTTSLVTGKNAFFPGSLFFHVPETAVHGNLYMGDGVINSDVAFQL